MDSQLMLVVILFQAITVLPSRQMDLTTSPLTIKVHVNWMEPKPLTLPEQTVLHVKLMNTAEADVASKTLMTSETDITLESIQNGIDVYFNVVQPLQRNNFMYSISAVMNIGWNPDSIQWIRHGDWLTTTHCSVPLKNHEGNQVNVTINMVKYD